MAFDGVTTKLIVNELNSCLINGKINKIYEPNKNEIILGIYNNGKNYALNCSIGADNYRLNLTTNSKPNPLNAPGFCMLLRKHLIGGKITKIYTNGLERIVIIECECYSELNDLITKKLVIELMGKHSNIILLNDKNIIIDSLRHLDSSSNSIRDILPAHPYEMLNSDKLDFLSITKFEEFYECTKSVKDLIIDIPNIFNGFSRILVQSILEELEISSQEVTKENLEKLYSYLCNIFNGKVTLKKYKSDFTVTAIDGRDDRLPFINFFIDDFYTNKEKQIDFYNYRNTVLKLVEGTLKKITKKLTNINSKLKECSDKDTYKLYGELITANMYKYNEFTNDFIEVENYYDNNQILKIPVNPNVSPSINAKNYYKKYNKMKNAIEIVNKQKLETIQELDYIESIIYSLENAKDINDVDEIYTEIKENDLFFSKKSTKAKSTKTKNTNKKVNPEYNPIEYKIENYTFLVGKNNKQNDYLSTKVLKNTDMWFHVKEMTSSHGILLTNNTTPSIDVIIRCAQIVAYYSKARQSSNVPVDYAMRSICKKAI